LIPSRLARFKELLVVTIDHIEPHYETWNAFGMF
jgi:hypothetical protein